MVHYHCHLLPAYRMAANASMGPHTDEAACSVVALRHDGNDPARTSPVGYVMKLSRQETREQGRDSRVVHASYGVGGSSKAATAHSMAGSTFPRWSKRAQSPRRVRRQPGGGWTNRGHRGTVRQSTPCAVTRRHSVVASLHDHGRPLARCRVGPVHLAWAAMTPRTLDVNEAARASSHSPANPDDACPAPASYPVAASAKRGCSLTLC